MSQTASLSARLIRAMAVAVFACTLIVALGLVSAVAQQAPTLRIESAEHDPAGSLTVTISGPGAGVLSVAEVSASVDGVDLGAAEALDGAAAAPRGAAVVIAIETSSSMLFGLIEQAQALANEFVDGLGPADRVAVVGYGDEAQVVSGFTTDRAATRAAIDALSLGDFAGIYEGVEVAATLAGSEPSASRAIVLMGWGWNFGGVGTATREGSLEAARASGAAVFWTPLGRDFDGDYYGDLTSSGGGRQLSAAELPGLAQELSSPAAPAQQRFRFATPVLPSGARVLSVQAGGEQLDSTFEVTNAGLIRVAGVSQAAADQPFVVRVESLRPLSELDLTASAAGRELPLEASGNELRVDPYAFDPGMLELTLAVSANGQPAASATATIEIATLDPELTLGAVEVEGGAGVAVSWRAQGAAALSLTVAIDGAVALATEDATATVAVPDGGVVVARLAGPGGVELASQSLEIDESGTPAPVVTGTAQAGGEESGGVVSTQLLAVLAITVAATAAAVLLVRRARQPGRPPEFDAGSAWASVKAALTRIGGGLAQLGQRFSRERGPERVEKERTPHAVVVVRDGQGEDTRLPIWQDQLSIGASRQCDVTLPGKDVRFVHLILTAVGDEGYRVFRFGPVALDDSGTELADDELVERGQWINVGGYLLSIESTAPLSRAA